MVEFDADPFTTAPARCTIPNWSFVYPGAMKPPAAFHPFVSVGAVNASFVDVAYPLGPMPPSAFAFAAVVALVALVAFVALVALVALAAVSALVAWVALAAVVALLAVLACFTLKLGASFFTSFVSAFASLCFAVITLLAANDVPPSARNSATIEMTNAGLGARKRFNILPLLG
jgi:hypothetical protein